MRVALCTAVVAVFGCAEPIVPVGGDSGERRRALVVEVPPRFQERLDLLFVVDNSETMSDDQMALEMAFDRLRGHLKFDWPDLHVGVVSTDLGVGDNDVSGCTPTGDEGRLQHTARLPACNAPDDRFIRDGDAEGTVLQNYDGALTDAFACISRLGESGCRFEQPLEAMRLALDRDHPYNQGFLRDDAVLAVVFLTNEDDCSVWNQELFDPLLDGSGRASKYRCFRHGVQCQGDDVRQEGHFEGCEPRRDSGYMPHVREYVDYLLDPTSRGLGKSDPPRQIVVSGMIGDADLGEVEVHLDGEGEPQVMPACDGDAENDEVFPAVRLQSFLDGFQDGGQVSSLCRSEPISRLTTTGREIRKRLGTTCLDGRVADVDRATPGRNQDCEVLIRWPDPRAPKTPIPECDDPYVPTSGDAPCYRIIRGTEMCGDFPTQLALDVWWGEGEDQPDGAYVEGWCLIDEPAE